MIRPMTEHDVLPAQEIILAAQKGVMYDLEPYLRKCLAEKSEFTAVAEVDGQIAGVVIGSLLGVLGMVDVLAVKAEYQGHGVGLALVEALIERVRAHGARKLVVLSWDHSAPFYEKLGFRADPGIRFMARSVEAPVQAEAVERQT